MVGANSYISYRARPFAHSLATSELVAPGGSNAPTFLSVGQYLIRVLVVKPVSIAALSVGRRRLYRGQLRSASGAWRTTSDDPPRTVAPAAGSVFPGESDPNSAK